MSNPAQSYSAKPEGYKQAVHDAERLGDLKLQLQNDEKLSPAQRSGLLHTCAQQQAKADAHLETVTRASAPDKRALFNDLMTPKTFHYVGRASHALMDRLIQADRDQPEQLQAYATALLKAPQAEGVRILTVLSHLESADPAALKSTLEGFSVEQLTSMVNQSKTQGLADTLKKYRENIVTDLSPLVVDQLKSLIPQLDAGVLAKGADTLQDVATEKATEKLTEALQDGLSATMNQMIDRLSGDGGIIRDRLFQMALTSDATDKKGAKLAEQVRTLAPGYVELKRELAEIERKFAKRQGEIASSSQQTDSPTETRYKALLLGQRLNRFQMELNLQQSTLDPALGAQYMAPLTEGLGQLTRQITHEFGLAQLSAQDTEKVLAHLTQENPSKEDLPEVDALVRGLLKQTPPASQQALLTQKSSVLTRYPQAAAPALLATLNDLPPEERAQALSGMSDEALKGFAKGLRSSERNTLMAHLKAEHHPELAPRLERLRGREPGYSEAQKVMAKFSEPPTALTGLSGKQLTKAFQDLAKAIPQLQDTQARINSLPKVAAEPLQGVAQALQAREELVSDTALASLSSEQKEALVKSIVTQEPVTAFNQQSLTRILESMTDINDMQTHLQTLQTKDDTGHFKAQQFLLKNKLVAAVNDSQATPHQRTGALAVLTQSGAYTKDNAQAVFEILMNPAVNAQALRGLLEVKETQKMLTQHIDKKSEVLEKMGMNTRQYPLLSAQVQGTLRQLAEASHPDYQSLEKSLPAAYEALDKIDKRYAGESALKRLVRKLPLRDELLASKAQLASLPEAYRVPLEAELDQRLQALSSGLTGVLKPSFNERLAQMTGFSRESKDVSKHERLAMLLVDQTDQPGDLQTLGQSLIRASSKESFHAPVFGVVQKLVPQDKAMAQRVFDQWSQSAGFDDYLKTALQSPEQRAVFAALDVSETLRNQIRRLTDV